jgi:hypothetical protein
MHFKHSQRTSILANANSINQSLNHLRIVFNLNLVNIKRLPPLIYRFNFSELFFTLFKKKTCENYLDVAIKEQIDCSEFPLDAWRVHGQPNLVTSDHVTQALVVACIFTEDTVCPVYKRMIAQRNFFQIFFLSL